MNVVASSPAQRPFPALDASVSARLRGVAMRLRCYVLLEGLACVIVFLFAAPLIDGHVPTAYSLRSKAYGLQPTPHRPTRP